jgi:hypothetical protein
MASFKELHFTPAEFAAIARIDKSMIPELESSGYLTTTRKKMGNVERKMISLEDMQRYFRNLREINQGVGALSAGPQVPIEAGTIESVAAATGGTPGGPGARRCSAPA